MMTFMVHVPMTMHAFMRYPGSNLNLHEGYGEASYEFRITGHVSVHKRSYGDASFCNHPAYECLCECALGHKIKKRVLTLQESPLASNTQTAREQ